MASYFDNSQTLERWIKKNSSSQEASQKLLSALGNNAKELEDDIVEGCEKVFANQSYASDILFKLLSRYGITNLKKESKMKNQESKEIKTAQSRPRNKWNRSLDGFNEGTPWRIARDKMYDFTHYYSDAISFDEDPDRVYSGEALWRMYVMDKYSSEYKDENGKWVGGYINDRFHVFPDAGTPANPDVPRDGGNPMQLANGERSKKPRAHEYSYERRLEEARGNKLKSIEVSASNFGKRIKISSKTQLPEERKDDVVYNVLTDCLDMREAGIEYKDILTKISDHYNISLINVAQIDRFAKNLKSKHENIGYEIDIKKKTVVANLNQSAFQVTQEVNVYNPLVQSVVTLQPDEMVVLRDNGQKIEGEVISGDNAGLLFELNNQDIASFVEQNVPIENDDMQKDADDLGLNEEIQNPDAQVLGGDKNQVQKNQTGQTGQTDQNLDSFQINDMSSGYGLGENSNSHNTL